MLESKVLLIEDDPAIVENLSAYLKEERFEVTAVDGQSKALEQIEADRPDIKADREVRRCGESG